MWDRSQRERLAVEEKLFDRYAPNFRFYDRTGDTYIEGWANTSNGSSRFKLRLEISTEFPYDEPDLYVVSPRTLCRYGNRGSINDLGTSHAFHVYSNGRGWVKICHSSDWEASMTCLKVIIKGHLWLEAYLSHLRTGRDIADFLNG